MVALPVAIYRWCWLGEFSVTTLPAAPSAWRLSGASPRVAILKSDYTRRLLPDQSGLDSHAEYWQELLVRLGMPSVVVSDHELETGVSNCDVLVLPSTVCLSEKQKVSIRSLLQAGGGVICTWATGTRDERGKWMGWDFLRELTGAVSFQPPARPAPWFISFQAGSPVTAGAPSGARLQVDSPERLQATALSVDAYWSDARLFPSDSNLPANFQGAVLHHELGDGRVVWFGFQENSAVRGASNKVILDAALTNAAAWTGHRTVVCIHPWPHPYRVGALLACNVGGNPRDAVFAARSLARGQARGTFFYNGDSIKGQRELARQIGQAGELAVHADGTVLPAQASGFALWWGLQSARWNLWRLGRKRPLGVQAPEEAFGLAMYRAMAAAGLRYFLTGGESETCLPAVMRVSQAFLGRRPYHDLVRLSRTAADDLSLSPLGIAGLEPQWIVRRLLADFEILRTLQGLYILSFHTEGLSSPEYTEVLAELIEQFRTHQAWIATAEEVADWWLNRSQIELRLGDEDKDSFFLQLHSRAAEAVEGLAITIHPAWVGSRAHVVAIGKQSGPAEILTSPGERALQLVVKRIEPGATCSYEVRTAP